MKICIHQNAEFSDQWSWEVKNMDAKIITTKNGLIFKRNSLQFALLS